MRCLVVLFATFLFVVNAFAQQDGGRRLLDTETHVVKVSKNADSVVFRMEAIADFTEDKDSSKPLGTGWDYAGIRVDTNNNNLIDEKVDVSFGTRQKTRNFCAQYLIRENTSSVCGALPSKGILVAEFQSTELQAKPHPVFLFTIPLSELSTGGGTIGLVFHFYDASKGRFSYPDKTRPYGFDKTIQLDLSEL